MTGPSRALFVGAMAALALALVWLGWHGFPRVTTDAIIFKQPAQMVLQTGVFARPTYGKLPHTERVLGEYPPLYVFANVLAFAGMGANQRASLALDLGVHWLLVLLIGGVVLHLARSSVPAIAYVLLSSSLLLPIGRPEELGALFVVAALLLASRGAAGFWIGAPLLGLALATAPSLAVSGTLVFVVYDGLQHGWGRRWLLRSAAIGICATSVLAALWAFAAWPHLTEAYEQFASAVAHPLRWTPTLLELFVGPRSKLAWGIPFLASTATLLALGSARILQRPEALPTPIRALVLSAPLAIGVHALLQRPPYDYRLLGHLFLAGALLLAFATARDTGARAWTRRAAILLGSGVVVTAGGGSFKIVQYALAPLAWDGSATTFTAAQQQIDRHVPDNASVGGQAELFLSVEDGRPYYALHWLAERPWPEYVLSNTFMGDGNVSRLLQRPEWAERLAREYEEITTPGPRTGCSVGLPLLSRRIPISRSPCDWNVRIWKRK